MSPASVYFLNNKKNNAVNIFRLGLFTQAGHFLSNLFFRTNYDHVNRKKSDNMLIPRNSLEPFFCFTGGILFPFEFISFRPADFVCLLTPFSFTIRHFVHTSTGILY